MHYLTVLLALLGGRADIVAGADAIHDCSNYGGKDVTARIWGVTFPGNVRSLTIRNCENLILNIATGGGTRRSLQHLTVRNVKNCEVVGSENCGGASCTSLPSHASFVNVDRMSVNVPLYDKFHFDGGVLQFKNVTIASLKTNSVGLGSSSLKKLSIAGSTLVMADREAITFRGSRDSLLEIKDSFLYSVGGNFIACNVTSAIIKRNCFICAKEGSFSLKTKNVIIAGNKAFDVEDCTFKLFTEDVDVGNTAGYWTGGDSLKGKICLGSSVENMRKVTLNSSKTYFDGHRSNTAARNNTIADGANGKVSRLGNGFFLLWFLALVLLTLMFPTAYFLKNLIFSVIDNALCFDKKHKRLLNEEDG